jgi:thiamine-phosphate pyrophosphorylase
VRRITPPGFLIGRSVHSVAEAAGAAPWVDYLMAGTVFPSRSKPADHPLLGVAGLAAVVAATDRPVLGIGGISPANARDVFGAGAAGVAGIDVFGEVRHSTEALAARVEAFRMAARASAHGVLFRIPPR